ncbi:MAG: hypothetical protein PVJ05_09780 [Candidatus Thorarchaeota archaeon]|jgi:hypothetical protein
MRVVGSAAGVKLHAQDDSYFSYFNSPYIGHDLGSAIDIYPHHQEWGGPVVSPVSGTVVRIKKMSMGQPKQFPTNDFDYGVGILPEESETDIVRILHCEPSVSEGETVHLGDNIGRAIRSRYFNYWTGPHYHVEIQPRESFRRSSKSYPLKLNYKFESKQRESIETSVEFLVDSVTEDHLVGYARNLDYAEIQNLSGVSAIVDNEVVGILDGGLPHYRIGGVIGTTDLKEGYHVNLLNSPVGTVQQTKSSVGVFRRGPSVTPFLDDIELRGISCFLYPKQFTKQNIPQMILIPQKYNQFKGLFNEGDLCKFRVTSDINTVKAE